MSVRQAHPRRRRAGATLLLALLGACNSWQVQPVAPADLIGRSSPSQVRIQLHDGRRVVLRQPALRADSLVSGSGGDGSAVAVAEIDNIAVRRFDAPRTVGLTALVVAVPVILCAAACQFPDFAPQ
jgi:hypothetical protein